MSDLRKNCNQGQQKQTLRISSPPPASGSSENPGLFRVNTHSALIRKMQGEEINFLKIPTD